MRRKREPLSRTEQLWFYLGAGVALVVLVLLGYRLGRNVALPAFLLFLLLVTIVGAWQERAERQAGEAAEDDESGA